MSTCSFSYFEYPAKESDTYAALAKKYRIPEKQLRDYNDNQKLCVRSKIKIPYGFGGCSHGAFYAIKKGETLLSIAQRNHVELDALLFANPYLNPSYYIPGQVIVVPQQSQDKKQKQYTLLPRERLFDVLRKFDMDLKTFCAMNPGVDAMNIKEHQRVNVAAYEGDITCRWYEISRGDTLRGIADKFGVKLPQLLAANEHLRPSEFVQGIRIRIPDNQQKTI